MKPFSMEPVLRYRKQLEDEARHKLFTSLEKQEKIQEKLTDATKRLSTLYTDLSFERTQGTTVDRLLLFDNRTLVEQDNIKELETELEQQEQVVERRRRHLLQASQDKKALEKLKERQNLAYKQYKDKKEAAMLDEIAVLRHRR